MNETVNKPLGIAAREPQAVSSTSSLDSMLNADPSIGDFESLAQPGIDEAAAQREPEKKAKHEDLNAQPEHQQLQQQSHEEDSMGAIPQSSVISPAAPPVSSAGERGEGGGDQASTEQPLTMPTLVLPPQLSEQPSPSASSSQQTPEFLYQLTKMLTDDNRDTIEWCKGKIEVHSPHRLESEVLHKYFRHSKFASFQRQLNYFGFRKQHGKGKMAPCSYVNENLQSADLSILLRIKRKTSVSMSAKEKDKQANKKETKTTGRNANQSKPAAQVNPVLTGILQRTSMAPEFSVSATSDQRSTTIQHAVAQAAVGRGIRHGYGNRLGAAPVFPSSLQVSDKAAVNATAALSCATNFDVNNPLSQLVTNYRNSLNDMASNPDAKTATNSSASDHTQPQQQQQENHSDYPGCFLSRDDSLVDLAMIPEVDEADSYPADLGANYDQGKSEDYEFSFIDFPNPDVYPPPSNDSAS